MYSHCDGLDDWFNCLGCKHICTSHCPIESPDVLSGLSFKYRAMTNEPGISLGPDDYIINDFDFNKGDA